VAPPQTTWKMDWEDDDCAAGKRDGFPLVALRTVHDHRDGVSGDVCKVGHILIAFVCPEAAVVALVKVMQELVRRPNVLVYS
jgi:hypothetical protein